MTEILKFSHRINTVQQLRELPKKMGLELDLRDVGGELILQHDPFSRGESFSEFLRDYDHSGLILNIKSEGIEDRCLKLMQEHKIKNFFFLDVSIPFIHRLIQRGERRVAVRYSSYEPLELALSFKGKVNWVWLDCFFGFHLPDEDYEVLKKHFKLCMVSPELQGRPADEIVEFKKLLQGKELDAVCTKRPDLW